MEKIKIQDFIDTTIYDFQTIDHLLACGRIKETAPILLQILERIQLFREQMTAWPDELKKIFEGDLSDKKKELSRLQLAGLDKDAQHDEYLQFLEKIKNWVYDNLFQLRQISKSAQQKDVERLLMVLSVGVFLICLLTLGFLRFFLLDWGLKGDFYSGKNFETHLATGVNKTIDFSYYLEMNPQMPYENSSARWHGVLLAPEDGEYTFYMLVDDGGKLYIDGQLLINAWKDNDSIEYTGNVFLNKGKHLIQVEYYNHLENSVLRLYWSYNDKAKKIISSRYLRCE